ncbi:NAD-dependent deacylase [Mycobacteroides abscessus]|uniref:NAD-dependent deacylase n=1 Tax=Mycobacteroides abscessus TaxID=36809 RepID=UPI00092BD49B|nr:NAD-dependent deacylase [Mycobacteroides abscessus]QCO29051.1 NAD-dependent deacylase [Mycobacteroides abscessus subsp. massiliense]SIK22699.1 NAD-dependent deacetylase (regulatory protein Sir2 homolog) [Mycobacteroides abscessus subsp. abscessus]SIM54750.1 NAD-dependent deacetylase (regulatory protein Sir2 homolog) [Mycobacteroides abscessus subsp. abscessus]SKL78987.1 NAD-dependent deacetylase [Mycobacteroides abscessus subsp. massiliense]SKM14812.1 NAD-dependent deacetylase [Mycobacteroi
MAGLVVLTGAGVSVESGLSVFRGPDGLWEGHQVSDVATPEGFAADPVTVQRFYNGLRRRSAAAEPNAAHYALARLECALGARMHLVTQNIDDLHQRAGSSRVTAMHGEVRKIRNVETGEILDWPHDVLETEAAWRPHVVWFGERTIGLNAVVEKLSAAELFVAIGTSGTVHPASQFAMIAKAAGATTVEINTEPTGGLFDECWAGPATQRVPELVDRILDSTNSMT